MIINGVKVKNEDINKEFFKNLPMTTEKDVEKLMKYCRKTIYIRTKELIDEGIGENLALETARKEANQRFGKGWRECMLTKTLYKESLKMNYY